MLHILAAFALLPCCGEGQPSQSQDMPSSRPDLSVILCGRNDGHGTDMTGDFVSRLRKTVLSLLHNLCARGTMVRSEVVLVEWRPPNSTRQLRDLLPQWVELEFVRRANEFNCALHLLPEVRIISISDISADAALRGIGQAPHDGMLEWHCKNVGLRRAAGDMLLTMNADDMLSPALFDFLAWTPSLRRDTFYLAQLEGMYMLLKRDDRPHYAIYEDIMKLAGGFAEDGLKDLVAQQRREVIFSDMYTLCKRPYTLQAHSYQAFAEFWDFYDGKAGIKLNDSSLPPGARVTMPRNFYDLYVGDFMLASRVAWRRINGAPLLRQSRYIDWLVSCRFARAGLRQIVLGAPCFVAHQNHPHSMVLKRRRVDTAPEWNGAGQPGWEQCRHPFRSLGSEHGALRRQWGFPKAALPETRLRVSGDRLHTQLWSGRTGEKWLTVRS